LQDLIHENISKTFEMH